MAVFNNWLTAFLRISQLSLCTGPPQLKHTRALARSGARSWVFFYAVYMCLPLYCKFLEDGDCLFP